MNGMRLLLEIGLWVAGLNTLVVLLIMAKRSLRGQGGYVALLVANLALAVILLATSHVDTFLSFVCIGVFMFSVLMPPVVARATRWALIREHMKLAIALVSVREVLQPGAGVGRLKRAFVRLARVRAGEVEEVIDELRGAQQAASEGGRTALDMEILSVLLSSRRYAEAVEHFEKYLGMEVLVFHTPLAAGMVQAYGEQRQLDRMAQVMELTEDSPAAMDPANAEPLTQARLAFLAQSGQADGLKGLLGPSSGFAQAVDDGMRAFWLGVARSRAGDVEGARRAFAQAEAGLRGRSILSLEARHLAALDGPVVRVDVDSVEGLGPVLRKVADRARIQASLPRLRGGTLLRLAPVTVSLIVLNATVWLLLETVGRGSGHPGTLIAAGANLKAAVWEGQAYRLVASVFLHAHWIHLALNMLVLWVLGRLCEQLLGSTRFWATYALSGVAGSLASLFFGTEAPLSVGASGAIFGLVGGAVAALVVERTKWPEAWRRSMVRLLVFLGILSLLPGMTIQRVDNWAHLGGLVGGALAGGLMMGPLGGRSMPARWICSVLSFAALGWTVWAGCEAARAGVRPLPVAAYTVGSHRFALPVSWHAVSKSPRVLRFQHLPTSAMLLIVDDSAEQFRDVDPSTLLRREMETLKKELADRSSVFRKTGPRLLLHEIKGWIHETAFYRSESAELVHGVFLNKREGRSSVIVLSVLVARQRVPEVREAVERLLRSFD